jgi:hypothetical protein
MGKVIIQKEQIKEEFISHSSRIDRTRGEPKMAF